MMNVVSVKAGWGIRQCAAGVRDVVVVDRDHDGFRTGPIPWRRA
jgi:hypothetical protein